MAKRSSKKLALTGSIVMERYQVKLSPAERRRFESDPDAFARRFLKRAGHKVNRVLLIKRAGVGYRQAANNWYHIVYPPIEHSGWICCCAD